MICSKYNLKMTLLFTSWICDECNPPKNTDNPTSINKIKINPNLWYTYGFLGDLVPAGYNVYRGRFLKDFVHECMMIYGIKEGTPLYLYPDHKRAILASPSKIISIGYLKDLEIDSTIPPLIMV